MQFIFSTTRKARPYQWICKSCRSTRLFSKSTISGRRQIPKFMSSVELREGGPARTRFAPSPTGYLHLGSLRTALFNYLVAKATGGQFLLRIEDTDQKRTIPDAEKRLFQDLEWAGIDWDEGPIVGGPYGPYRQSERTELYRRYAEELLESGHAYRCFCTPARLHEMASHRAQSGQPSAYDRRCASISRAESEQRALSGESCVIRLKAPDIYPPFFDLVHGKVRKSKLQHNHDGYSEDIILLKSDGFPTYHLANVVDDHLMQITHVIRGAEWMSSTPNHLAIYQAFGWKTPSFAHVSLLVDKNHQKLSKRTGSIDIASYRDRGIFPEALNNFVALLGWSHGGGKDMMSMEGLISKASMKFTTGDTVVSFEKLEFLQRRHAERYAKEVPSENPRTNLMELAVKPMVKILDNHVAEKDYPLYERLSPSLSREKYVESILLADVSNYKTPTSFITRNELFFTSPSTEAVQAALREIILREIHSKILRIPQGPLLNLEAFDNISKEEWNGLKIKEQINADIASAMESTFSQAPGEAWPLATPGETPENTKLRVNKVWSKLIHGYLRGAIMAGKDGPDGAETMRILGKEETMKRLRAAEDIFRDVIKSAEESGDNLRAAEEPLPGGATS